MSSLSTLFVTFSFILILTVPVIFLVFLIQWTRKKPKKKTGIAIIAVICSSILCMTLGFFTTCHHTWEEATCISPKTCLKCGVTDGESLGHEWKEATCIAPKICMRCGETDGVALGHEWKEATCTDSKTCMRCGETDGVALGHVWQAATLEAPKTCERCGKKDGNPLECADSVKYVKEGYDAAVSYAETHSTDYDYAYNSVYEAAQKLLESVRKNDKDGIEKYGYQLYGFEILDLSNAEIKQRTNRVLQYVVAPDENALNALMKMFEKSEAVQGTITPTDVDIVVNDVEKLTEEIGTRDEIVGGILSVLECYNISWLGENPEPAVCFDVDSFSYKWRAFANFKLTL